MHLPYNQIGPLKSKKYLTRVFSAKPFKQLLMYIISVGVRNGERAGAYEPEAEAHPKPLSKSVKNMPFAVRSDHLKGRVRGSAH